jgi:hypothetical protein
MTSHFRIPIGQGQPIRGWNQIHQEITLLPYSRVRVRGEAHELPSFETSSKGSRIGRRSDFWSCQFFDSMGKTAKG